MNLPCLGTAPCRAVGGRAYLKPGPCAAEPSILRTAHLGGVQEPEQFTMVHLVNLFTKLADQPLTKLRGFPAPVSRPVCQGPQLVLAFGG